MEDGDGDAEGGGHRQAEAQRRDERHPDGTEDEQQHDEREPQHDGQVGDKHVGEALGDVIENRRDAGDAEGSAGLRLEVRLVVAQAVKGVGGGLVGSAGGRGDKHLGGVHVVRGLDDLGVVHTLGVVELRQHVAVSLHPVLLGHVGGVHVGDHRGVAARAEGVGGHFVRVALR